MCGFVGFTNTPVTADPAAVVKAMADRIVHRGPVEEDHVQVFLVGFGVGHLDDEL